jgi:hypothetical protein
MKNIARTMLALAAVVAIATPAWAQKKDIVQGKVDNFISAAPLVVTQKAGAVYTIGDWTDDRLVIQYTLPASSWTEGDFGSFDLAVRTVAVSGSSTGYPLSLAVTAANNTNRPVKLAVSKSSLYIDSAGGSDWLTVGISIDCSGPAGCVNQDGKTYTTKLDIGNNNAVQGFVGKEVWVRVTLINPSTCVGVYNWVTDTTLAHDIEHTDVNANNRKVVATNPFGQWSQNVLVVNADAPGCQNEWVDIWYALDSRFQTNPVNNPGNAVFTWTGPGTLTPATFAWTGIGGKTKWGQEACAPNLSVAPGSSVLLTVKNNIITGGAPSSLGTTPFEFSGGIAAPSATCGAHDPIELDWLVFWTLK